MRIPLITTFYGLDVNKLPKRSFWKKRYPLIFDYGCAFIVEGHFMKSQLVSLGCPSEKIKVVHLGVDIQKIEAADKEEKRQNSSIKILFVGLEREKKGPVDAIKAFIKTAEIFPDVELNIIGNGKYRTIVEKMSIENGIRKKVIFHGYVNVDTYLDLLVMSDIVFAPSCNASDGDTEGGAPVVLLEAQAAGKPVVSTFHCDIPEVVKDGVSGLLSAEHDIRGLSDNLLKFCRSKELREKFGAAGKEHIKENHDIRKQVKVLSDIYDSFSRS
jgi:colanic acid/amylovoran biosynthesis glycosyltransferase